MNRNEVDALKVGDEVGLYRSGNWGDIADHAFGNVTKLTPKTRQITVETEAGTVRRFNANGTELGEGYSKHYLIKPEALRARIAERNAQRQTNRRAKELLDEIQKHKTGMGDYQFDEEARGKLLGLVAQL